MKQATTLGLGALILLCGAAAWAEGYTVVLHNPESSSLHYQIDPPELAGFDPSSSVFPNVVYDYLTEEVPADQEAPVFSALGPGQTARLEDLSEGIHLLVGFFALPGEREFPVRVISLQAGGGLSERNYTVYAEPAVARVRAGRGRLGAHGPIPTAGAGGASGGSAAGGEPAAGTGLRGGMFRFQIDNEYEDWEAIPPVLSYPVGHAPQSFTRERYGGSIEVLPIGSARHWNRGGTSLAEVKIVNDAQGIYVYAAARTAIDPNLSLFFYLQGESQAGAQGAAQAAANDLTLELVPGHVEEPGLVVLWERGSKPAIVGELASGTFFLEARVDKARMERALLQVDPEVRFFDLTTAFFDRGELSYEEFYYGSIDLSEIPTLDTLYSSGRP